MRESFQFQLLPSVFATLVVLFSMFGAQRAEAADYSTTLGTGQWEQLVFPLLADSYSIETLLGDDLPVSGYGSTWNVFTFNPASGAYVNPGVSGVIESGHAFWIIQMTGSDVEIDIDSNLDEYLGSISSACRSDYGCWPVPLVTRVGEITWQMAGSPFPGAAQVSNFAVVSLVSGTQCTNGCNLDQAEQSGYVNHELFYYASATEQYQTASASSTLNSWQGFWLATLPGQAGTNQQLLLPSPLICAPN